MEIRPFIESDWSGVWPIVRQVVRAADTFAYDPAMTEAEARALWIESPPGLTVVALEDERILGTAKMGANRPGPGSHVATASFMVAAEARGRGVGTAGRDSPACSSTPSPSPTAARSRSIAASASTSSAPYPAPSRTRRWGASDCT
jgi:hypothetical protein